ncbi:MAG: helix-turn-helix transcriptional regulator [Nitrospirae bacterium]|nr:helix-turn-helix transcriptional regulator [Nitrospirota bacterium]
MRKKKLTPSREIGEKIKKLRRERRISQEELAEILGVTYQQVQRYENGTNRLNVENIQAVAAALSVPVTYFFNLDTPLMLAEERSPYLPGEEGILLKYFRKIKNTTAKNIVIQVAKLASKK